MISSMEPRNAVQLDDMALQNFKSALRGTIISREDPSYDQERKVYNGMIDKHPLLIVKCRNVADAKSAVNFARSQKLLLAIRSGGHNAGGLGLCDDGLVIDLSLMRGTRVDMKSNTIRVEGDALLGDVDHATRPIGKAVPSGILSTTGIAGLLKEAMEAAGRAVQLDKNSYLAHWILGQMYHFDGQYDEAIRSYTRSLEISRKHSWLQRPAFQMITSIWIF